MVLFAILDFAITLGAMVRLVPSSAVEIAQDTINVDFPRWDFKSRVPPMA